MQSMQSFDFFSLNFDENGSLTNGSELDDLKRRAASATDAIFMAHGFRNDAADATTLYSNFLNTFRGHFKRPEFQEVASRNFVIAGLYWPSMVLPESFGAGPATGPTTDKGSVQSADDDALLMATITQKLQDLKAASPTHSATLDQAIALLPQLQNDADAQNRFSTLILSILDATEPDPTEGLERIRQQEGSVLLQKLRAPVILPTQVSDGDSDSSGGVMVFDDIDSGGAESIGSFFGSILGGIDKFINLTSWYVMKNRSGVVGATGAAKAVRELKPSNPNIKIHLVGHSLGGRLMAACAKTLTQDPMLQPDSLTLLEAAFSHYGFSDNNGEGTPGFFRDVIAKKVVKGPFLETFSAQDTVVGQVYAIASRLADDNAKAIGDATDAFGGIGRNGAQKTVESVFMKLKTAVQGGPYNFQIGVVNCLDGSGGLIKDHGDVTNQDVTYAFASSVAATSPVETALAGSALG